jgi:tRNA(Ile)-lysidine synthase
MALVEASVEFGIVLSAAHVHHGLRGEEADGDEAFVRELCARLGVPLEVFRVDTAARQAAEGEGLEEAARELRYAALRGLQVPPPPPPGGLSAVVEGGGDSSHISEARHGAPAFTRVVRPLLGVRRVEVEAFLRSREQGWREDSSNRDTTLTRNRVRHELMPMLRSFNPNVDTLLARTASVARDEEVFWQAEVERVLPGLLLPGTPVRGGGRAVSTAVGEQELSMELARLQAMPAALRRRVVRAAAKRVGVGMSGEETAKALALAGFGGHAEVKGKIGSRLELHGGLRVERSAREIRFRRVNVGR